MEFGQVICVIGLVGIFISGFNFACEDSRILKVLNIGIGFMCAAKPLDMILG